MNLDFIFKNDKIRVFYEHDRPLISVADVAREIDDHHCREYVHLAAKPEDTKMYTDEDTLGIRRNIHVFTKRGLYRYLLRSSLPKAKEFQEHNLDILCNIRIP